MNALTFQIKLAHLRATSSAVAFFKEAAVRLKKPMLEDMTPARFDIMQAVFLVDEPDHRRRAAEGRPALPRLRPMAGLIKVLGLAASTVSHGVKRLAEIGWLLVRRRDCDRRIADVFLTEEGLEALALAKQCLEHEPRELPGFADEEGARRPIASLARGRGTNARTRELIKGDRLAHVHDEAIIQEWERASIEPHGFAQVMEHHFFRVVDNIARIATFFGAKALPLHDPRDESVFELYVEDHVPSWAALARRAAFAGEAFEMARPLRPLFAA